MDPDADRTKNEEPVLPMAGHHRPLAVAKLGRRVEDTREHAVTWSWRRCCFYYSETLWLLLMLVLGLQQCKRERVKMAVQEGVGKEMRKRPTWESHM